MTQADQTTTRRVVAADCRAVGRCCGSEGEHEGTDPQPPAQGDEAVAEEEQGIAGRHEEDQGEPAQGRKPVAGEGIQLAEDARQAEGRKSQRQVAAAPLLMAQPVHDREYAKCQEAEADGSLNHLERQAHQGNFTPTPSEKATSGDVR